MASQPNGWAWPGAPLFLRVIPAVGVCYRCGRAGGCNCAAQASALPRLYTEAEVAARVAEARTKALEEAAGVADNVCDTVKARTETPRKRAREDGHLSEECHQEGKWHGAHDCQEEIATAIRALKEAPHG